MKVDDMSGGMSVVYVYRVAFLYVGICEEQRA